MSTLTSFLSSKDTAYWLSMILSNFDLFMFDVAVVFIIFHRLIAGRRHLESEIVFRWIALFALGFTGIYAFIMHAFYPDLAATNIGWKPSPFQFEVALADLTIGVLGILSFLASYGFRLATVIASICFLWGAAAGHINQMIVTNNYALGNSGSWFWMDILIPLILLVCIIKLRPGKLIVV